MSLLYPNKNKNNNLNPIKYYIKCILNYAKFVK